MNGSSEMDHIESRGLGLCISIFCIPGKRDSHGQSNSLRAVPTDGHRNQYSQQPRNKCVRYEWERSSTVYAVDGLSLRSYLGLQSVITGILHPASPVGPDPWVFHVAPGQFLVALYLYLSNTMCLFNFLLVLFLQTSFELFSFPFYVLAQLFLTLPLGT